MKSDATSLAGNVAPQRMSALRAGISSKCASCTSPIPTCSREKSKRATKSRYRASSAALLRFCCVLFAPGSDWQRRRGQILPYCGHSNSGANQHEYSRKLTAMLAGLERQRALMLHLLGEGERRRLDTHCERRLAQTVHCAPCTRCIVFSCSSDQR